MVTRAIVETSFTRMFSPSAEDLLTRVGLIELPALKLVDEDGLNWTALRHHEPLGSKQIIAAQLADAGFETDIVNLKAEDGGTDFGKVTWRGLKLTKIAVGTPWRGLSPGDYEIWGLTVNYLQEREVACAIISHIRNGGRRIIVGGSDAFAEPEPYLRAGADAIVQDKSGAANIALLRYMTEGNGIEPSGVLFADGRSIPAARPPMTPQRWPLPERSIIKAALGMDYWEAPLPARFTPIGSVMLDIGCDRHCDFCETPLYGLGYKAMSPDRAAAWLEAQAGADANSAIVLSDQFLGRVLWPGGREAVIEIMNAARSARLPILWGNGIELKKATTGRGLPGGDLAPDPEIVQAVWGWDGHVGCAQAYIPAERPLMGAEAYAKLLPWEQHCRLMESIVAAGVPDITYGVIVGLPDDSHESLSCLFDAVLALKERLKNINSALKFRITPYAIRPLPGTPQTAALRHQDLLRFSDPTILGGFWTACADTKHMSYEDVSRWQFRLIEGLGDSEENWQGISALSRGNW